MNNAETNGNPFETSSSSSLRGLDSLPRKNLLSTYLASDDEDCFDTNDLIDDANKRFHNVERIEILAPLKINCHNNAFSCDNNTNVDDLKNKITNKNFTNYKVNVPVQENYVNIWNDNLIESATPRRAQYRVIFEIIKARTITGQDRQRYVNYTILMKRIPGLETEPAIIERRYSEFRTFYNSIRRKYSSLLKDITFPKKIFIGNFSTEVIAERSLAFQKFLTHCLSLPEIRCSKEFATFLYYPELNEAKNCLKTIRLEEAASIFENVYYIQNKLCFQNGQPNGQLIHTLCCLIGCLNAVDNTTEARKLAKKAFELLFENPIIFVHTTNQNNQNNNCTNNENTNNNNNNNSKNNNNNDSIFEVNNLFETSPLIFPLILLSLRHEWFSGRQKIALEKKLEELSRRRSLSRNFDIHPKLLETILKKDFSPFF